MLGEEFELNENSPSGPQKPLTFNELGAFSLIYCQANHGLFIKRAIKFLN